MENYIVFVWIIFAVFMLICEGLTTQLVSIWFVIGAVAAAVTCIFTDNILIQSIVFITVSLVALAATRPLVKKIDDVHLSAVVFPPHKPNLLLPIKTV